MNIPEQLKDKVSELWHIMVLSGGGRAGSWLSLSEPQFMSEKTVCYFYNAMNNKRVYVSGTFVIEKL